MKDVVALYKARLGEKGEETESQKEEKMELRIVLSHFHQEQSRRGVLNSYELGTPYQRRFIRRRMS